MNYRFYILLIAITSMALSDLIKPSLSESLRATHVLFEWEQEPDANGYSLQVSDTESFSDLIINIDLPILGVREDIYKIETMDRKEANAIINRNSARIKTENKIRFFDFAINAFTYCILVPLILLMALENGSGG